MVKFFLITALTLSLLVEVDTKRAIIEVSRGVVLTGEVIRQDENVLVLQDSDGKLHVIELDKTHHFEILVDSGEDKFGTVILKDGRRLRGTILENEFEEVFVRVNGIELHFDRTDVELVTLDPPFEESYSGIIGDTNFEDVGEFRFLIEWLIYKNKFELAKIHLDDCTLTSPRIDSLRRRVELKLTPRPKNEVDVPVFVSKPSEAQIELRVLTPKEVSLIRAYESNVNLLPDMNISDKTRRKLIQEYGNDPLFQRDTTLRTTVLEGDDHVVFRLIRYLNAEHLYEDIHEIDEPVALQLFRTHVHDEWLVNRCGTTDCHGGANSGPFFLFQEPKLSDQSRYANLLTLELLQINPELPLINYDQPYHSLLMQYGLDREEARHPHPDVRGWKPVKELQTVEGRNAVIEWIQSMRQMPRPQYPIDFPLLEVN